MFFELFPAFDIWQVVGLCMLAQCCTIFSVQAMVRKSVDIDTGWCVIFPVHQDLVCGAASFGGWSVAQQSMALPAISGNADIAVGIGLWGQRDWPWSNWGRLGDGMFLRCCFWASVHLFMGVGRASLMFFASVSRLKLVLFFVATL